VVEETLVEVSGFDSGEPVEVVSGNVDGLAPEVMGGGLFLVMKLI
jgi:hypothetical protein